MKQPSLSAVLCFFISALGLALAGGCNVIPPVQPDLTRYYVLSGPSVTAPAMPTAEGTLRLGLRPVEIAPYLRRAEIVTRTGDNEVSFAHDARWAEPLEQEISNSLRQGLLTAPTVGRVFTTPFPFEPARDFDVSVRILRCEGVRERNGRAVARLAAAIEISTVGENPQIVARRTFQAADEAWDGKDFAHLAASLSQAVGALSQEVVASLPEKK